MRYLLFCLLLLLPMTEGVHAQSINQLEQVERVEPSSRGERVVESARSQIGSPYRWGGSDPSGFDCSGLATFSLREAGIEPAGRTVWQLWSAYDEVETPMLGDLVFFQNTYIWGVSHIGIYIGNDQFIHAASPAYGVIISSLRNPYWRTRFLGFTRPY
jgi:peptidoglycan endopeptidase LytE